MTVMPEHDGPQPPPETPYAPAPPGDPERRLAEAAARSPELAAMLGGRGGRRSAGGRRVALLLAAVASLALVAVAVAVRRTSPQPSTGEGAAAAPLRAGESPGTLIAPLEAAADPTTGEVVSAFSGFAVSVETEPPGAIVTIDGKVRGESPVFAGLDCRPGDEVRIRAEKAGSGAAKATTTCRADTLVRRSLRLRP